MLNEKRLKNIIKNNLAIDECKAYLNGNISKQRLLNILSKDYCPPEIESNCKHEINCYECWKGYILDVI